MKFPCVWRTIVPLASLAFALAARPVQAQGAVSITPFAGVFVPTKNSFASLGNDIKRSNSFIGGARLTFWSKSPLGLEFVAGYAPARVEVAGATINASRHSNVVVGGLKLMLGVSPVVSPLGVYVGVGPAIIRRGTYVLQSNRSQTDFGGVVGGGVRLPLGHSIGVRFDVEDYLYGGDFSGTKQLQNDLALTAGLSVSF